MAAQNDRFIDYHGILELYYDNILELYLCYEDKEAIMVLDLTVLQLYVYTYMEYTKDLTEKEQQLLAEHYSEPLTNRFVSFYP
jgi:hypothetical protein